MSRPLNPVRYMNEYTNGRAFALRWEPLPLNPSRPPVAAPAHLLEVFQVAHRLSMSAEFVRRLIRQRKLPAIRLGARSWRVDPRDLDEFLNARHTQPTTDARPPTSSIRAISGAAIRR